MKKQTKSKKINFRDINVTPWLWVAGAAALGGVAFFFLDPKRGSGRRALIKNKAQELSRRGQELAQKAISLTKGESELAGSNSHIPASKLSSAKGSRSHRASRVQ